MFSFIFAVFGSVTFWIIFAIVGFVCATGIMRHIAPKTYKWVSSGFQTPADGYGYFLAAEAVFAMVLIYLFWPFILIYLVITGCIKLMGKLVLGPIFVPLFVNAVKGIGKAIPTIKIEKRE